MQPGSFTERQRCLTYLRTLTPLVVSTWMTRMRIAWFMTYCTGTFMPMPTLRMIAVGLLWFIGRSSWNAWSLNFNIISHFLAMIISRKANST
jgi:hypothetical protein